MASPKLYKMFVYGTLKSGEPNHYWLTSPLNGNSQFLCTGKTSDKFPLTIATQSNIPMLLDKKGVGNQIEGEIYEIDEKMVRKLDKLGQYPVYYDREIQDIITEDGTAIPCWMYLIRRFDEALLSQELLTKYTDSAELPYCDRYYSDLKKADDENKTPAEGE